jgi:hypothetical protein
MATKDQMVLPTTRRGYNLVEKIDNVIPIVFPPLVVAFENKLSAEELENLKGFGGSVLSGSKDEKPMLSFGGHSVDKDLLRLLYTHAKKAKPRNPTPAGSVNLSQFQGLLKALGIITWFLKTQSYPAFTGPVPDDQEGGSNFDTIEGFVTMKRKGNFGERQGKRARADNAAMVIEDEDDDEDSLGIEDISIGDAGSKLPKAKPSTPPEVIFGNASQMPSLPGLCFPYFSGMLDADQNFSSAVIREYFLECLGNDVGSILSGHKDIKGALGSLGLTETGKVLQHIFCGVKLAIESQARLYLVIDGSRYLGFTLHGWYFTVSIDGYKHAPFEYPVLVGHIQLVDEHSVAIANILLKLASMKIDGKKPTKKFLQDQRLVVSKNPRLLAELIRKFDLSDHEDVEEIEKLANKLSFPQRFWDFSAANILQAVDLLLDGTFPNADQPLYIRGGTLTTIDPKLSIFALFGDSGFSFRNPGGSATKVPKDKESDTLYKPYRGKNNKEVKPNPTLVVAKKSLGLSVEDWKLFMADHRFLNKNSRDQAFRSVSLGGPKGKDLWFGLIERIGPLDIVVAAGIQSDEVQLGVEDLDDIEDSFLDYL